MVEKRPGMAAVLRLAYRSAFYNELDLLVGIEPEPNLKPPRGRDALPHILATMLPLSQKSEWTESRRRLLFRGRDFLEIFEEAQHSGGPETAENLEYSMGIEPSGLEVSWGDEPLEEYAAWEWWQGAAMPDPLDEISEDLWDPVPDATLAREHIPQLCLDVRYDVKQFVEDNPNWRHLLRERPDLIREIRGVLGAITEAKILLRQTT